MLIFYSFFEESKDRCKNQVGKKSLLIFLEKTNLVICRVLCIFVKIERHTRYRTIIIITICEFLLSQMFTQTKNKNLYNS